LTPLFGSTVRQHSRRLAWTSAIIHGLVHASVLMLPPLLGDLQRTYRVSLLQVLAVANAMYLVYGLAAVPAGFLADRFGSRRMLVTAAGGCGLALMLTAAAPNFAVLAIGLIGLGICAGVYHPSGLSLLSRGVAAGERGRAIGIHGAGGSLGEALAPAWAAFFAAMFDWRIGFLAAGVLAFACALLAASLPAEVGHDHDHGDHHHHHFGAGVVAETGPSLLGLPPRRPSPSLAGTLRAFASALAGFWHTTSLRWLLAALVAAGFVYRGFLTFLSLHMAAGGAGVAASYVMSGVLVVGMLAQRWGGELADRRQRERLFVGLTALMPPVLIGLAFAHGAAAIALALVCGFVWAVAQPVANALTAAYARPADHGLLYGIQFAVTFGVGSFATTGGGFLLEAGGTRLVMLGLAAVALVQLAAVAALLAAATRRRTAKPGRATRDDGGADRRAEARPSPGPA
jgi:MFS family permease